jgi:uncharacterized membrane protein
MVIVTGIALLFSLVLTVVEAVVIHAFCQYCVVSAVLVVILFGLSLSYWRDANREGVTDAP